MNKIKVWAHRGASAYAPENTLEAFALAVKMGADGIELDVQMTKDGYLVVIHDETIDRVSNGNGFVRDYTLRELKRFQFNKNYPEYKDSRIPTLKEVYELLRDTSLCVNVELKTGIYFYDGLEERVLELTKRMRMDEQVWYSSFNHASIRKIKEISPESKTGVLYADGIWEAAAYVKQLGADALHPALHNLQYAHFAERVRKLGLQVHTWTVNTLEQVEMCRKIGVDAIITDYPDVVREGLKYDLH